MAPKKRKEVEDPSNTWNMQLMAAALRFDTEEASRLIEKGACASTAREVTPFTPDDKLSPVAAVLLQGDLGPQAIAMLRFLLEHGASLDDRMPLPRHSLPSTTTSSSSGGGGGGGGGVLAGIGLPVTTTTAATAFTAAALGGAAESKRGGHAPPGEAASETASLKRLSKASASPLAAATAVSSAEATPAADVEEGTVLHYLIAVADPVHLLQLLLLAGTRRDGMRAKLPDEDAATPESGAAAPASPEPHAPASRGGSARGARSGAGLNNNNNNNNNNTAASSSSGAGDHGKKRGLETRRQLLTPDPPVPESGAAVAAAATPAPVEQEPICVLPHTLTHAIAQAYTAQKAAVLDAAAAATAAEAGTAGRSPSRAGLGGSARSRSASMRASPAPVPARSRLPILAAFPSPTDRQRLLITAPGVSGTDGLCEVTFDLSTRTSRSGLTAVEFAVERADLLSTRLLLFYGAHLAHGQLVNGTQTALARACTSGQVELVELLLNAGAPLGQLSADGRYTLMHYAVGQPAVLDYLVRRGLSMEAENAFGESVLISLIRYGTGRNSKDAIHETVNLEDVQKLASLPHAALRNYILMPLPPPGTAPAGKKNAGGAEANSNGTNTSKAGQSARTRGVSFIDKSQGTRGDNSSRRDTSGANTTTTNNVADAAEAFARMGAGEMGTWWSFTPHPTAVLIGHVLEAGANFHGYVPDEELGLASVRFAEEEAARHVMDRELAASLVAPASGRRDEAGGGAGGSSSRRQGPLGKKRASASSLNARSPVTTAAPAANFGGASPLDEDESAMAPDALEASSMTANTLGLARSSNASQSASQLPLGGGGAGASGGKSVVPSTATLVPGRPPLRLTPLMHAIYNYHPELIAKLVLEYKVDLSRRDSFGATALHYACVMVPQQSTSVLRLLLDVLLKESTGAGQTGTTLAGNVGSGGGGVSAAASAAGSGAQSNARRRSAGTGTGAPTCVGDDAPFDINAVDMAGMTALHYAAACGNDAAVELLLATVGSGSSSSSSASHPTGISSSRGNNGVGSGGSAHGAHSAGGSGGHNTNAMTMLQAGRPDARGRTALHWAVMANAPRVVTQLIRHNGTVAEAALEHGTGDGLFGSFGATGSTGSRGASRARGTSPSTSLSLSQRRASAMSGTGNNSFASAAAPATLAVSPYAAVDVETEEAESRATALELAIKRGRDTDPAIIHALLREGNANFFRPSGLANGGTLLHRAVKDGHVGCVQALLDQYADPNEVDDKDETPLFVAIRELNRCDNEEEEEEEAVEDSGDDVVSRTERMAIVEALLRAGARVDAQSVETLATPLHLVAATGRADVLTRLFTDVTSALGTNSIANAVLQRRASRAPAEDGEGLGDDTGAGAPGRLGIAERVRAARRVASNNNNNINNNEVSNSASVSLTSPLGSHNVSPPPSTATAAAPGPNLVPLSYWLLSNDRDETPLHLLCAREGTAAQTAAVPLLDQLLHSTFKVLLSDVADGKNEEALRERLLTQQDHQGRTALHAACRAHFVEAVACLLAARPASVFALDARGWSPLHDAVAFRHAPGAHEKEKAEATARMIAVLEALAASVTQQRAEAAPAPSWWGVAPSPSSVEMGAAMGASLSAQIEAYQCQEAQWLYMCAELDHTRASGSVRRPTPTLREYAACVEERGRTALLLAGDVGNTAAAKAVLKIFFS